MNSYSFNVSTVFGCFLYFTSKVANGSYTNDGPKEFMLNMNLFGRIRGGGQEFSEIK